MAESHKAHVCSIFPRKEGSSARPVDGSNRTIASSKSAAVLFNHAPTMNAERQYYIHRGKRLILSHPVAFETFVRGWKCWN